MTFKVFDLEERLVDFAVKIIELAAAMPVHQAGSHIAGQLARSGTAPAAHYGEAQGAESRADFVHKMKIALNELRETRVWLLIMGRADLIQPPSRITPVLEKNNELISIFVTSIQTARKNK